MSFSPIGVPHYCSLGETRERNDVSLASEETLGEEMAKGFRGDDGLNSKIAGRVLSRLERCQKRFNLEQP
jgi:hypothetical protein